MPGHLYQNSDLPHHDHPTPDKLRLPMFSVCGQLKLLEGNRFTFLQQNIVFENIKEELI